MTKSAVQLRCPSSVDFERMMARYAGTCPPERGFITSLLVGRPQIQERVRVLRGAGAAAIAADVDEGVGAQTRGGPPPDSAGPADEAAPAPVPRPKPPLSGAHATALADGAVADTECASAAAMVC